MFFKKLRRSLRSLRSWFARCAPSPRRHQLHLTPLEDRSTPAVGFPWADPGHLSLSFVPDGSAVTNQSSNMFASLDANLPTAVWRREILRAFQTWAVQSNINIAVNADNGAALGSAGPVQGDARFGDIRIGGVAMTPETLSISIPHDPFSAGTWSGDVLLNSNAKFGPAGNNLFSVALHEAGHALGLDHSNFAYSPLFHRLQKVQQTRLTIFDIANLQSLYGRRAPDMWEGRSGNYSYRNATRLDPSGGFDGETPLAIFGDITTNYDVDMYWFRTTSDYDDAVTVRLQSAGRSLLAPKVTVLDAAGHVLGQASSTSTYGDTITVRLAETIGGAKYYVRVEGATRDVFGIGSYGMAVSFDEEIKTPPEQIDAVLRGPYEKLSLAELQAFFDDPGHDFNDDGGGDDDIKDASRLSPALGYAPNTHFTTIASLATAADVDTYEVRAPRFARNARRVFTATAWTLESTGAAPRVQVLDRHGNPIPANILANGNGTFIVQAANIESDQRYVISVYAGPGQATGNYTLDIGFGTRLATPATFVTAATTAAKTSLSTNLYIAQTQLFHLLLSAQGTAGGMRMTIFDAQNAPLTTLSTNVGDAVSGPGLLIKPGTYRIVFESIDGSPVAFQLVGKSNSTPIGPLANDPSSQPQFVAPSDPNRFLYPDEILTSAPYYFALLLF